MTSENKTNAQNKLWIEKMARSWHNEAVYLYISFLKSNLTLRLQAFNGSVHQKFKVS